MGLQEPRLHGCVAHRLPLSSPHRVRGKGKPSRKTIPCKFLKSLRNVCFAGSKQDLFSGLHEAFCFSSIWTQALLWFPACYDFSPVFHFWAAADSCLCTLHPLPWASFMCEPQSLASQQPEALNGQLSWLLATWRVAELGLKLCSSDALCLRH